MAAPPANWIRQLNGISEPSGFGWAFALLQFPDKIMVDFPPRYGYKHLCLELIKSLQNSSGGHFLVSIYNGRSALRHGNAVHMIFCNKRISFLNIDILLYFMMHLKYF